MSLPDTNIAFNSNWDIDQLFSNYPKTVQVTIPAQTYPNYYYALVETLPSILVLASGNIHVSEGYYKSVTDNDVSWHQLGEQGWIPSTGGAARSGANLFCALAVSNGAVYLQSSNWQSGPGGANRSVTLSIRYHLYADKLEY